MGDPAPFDPALVAKDLLRTSRHGALATLMTGTGAPYSSLVATASAADGAPLLLISRLAVHTRNIDADGRVSLMLAQADANDPLTAPRIMVAGVAERLGGAPMEAARGRYLAAHPSAEVFVNFTDFSFFRLAPQGLHLVAGFGRIVDLAAAAFLTDLAGAESLLAAEADVIAHMNADHSETLALYASRLLGALAGPGWQCVACDPEGLDLQSGDKCLRLRFPERVTTLGALRLMLKTLADIARHQTDAKTSTREAQ